MKLTPLEIRKQEFKKVMRGYDPEEVEAFLGMVADEMELIITEKNQLNDELIKLRTQLQDYQRVESTLRETLVKAQHTVEESRVNSRREAEIMIHEAELQAEHILKEAREELLNLRHEISLVKTQKESFARRLRHLLQSQIELLEVMEMEDKKRDHYLKKEPISRPQSQVQQQGAGQEAPGDAGESREEPIIVRGSAASEPPPAEPPQQPDSARPARKEGGSISDQFIV